MERKQNKLNREIEEQLQADAEKRELEDAELKRQWDEIMDHYEPLDNDSWYDQE